mgnify:CR=1 FL=1
MGEVRIPADVPAQLVDELGPGSPPGSFRYWSQRADGVPEGLNFSCPCGCGAIYGAHWRPGGWTWDGDLRSPTVRPSLGCYAAEGGYHWHGWLSAGKFIQA